METQYDYPSFTKASPSDFGFIGHGVETQIPKKDRSRLLGKRLPSFHAGVFLRKDDIDSWVMTLFTYSASSRVYRFRIERLSTAYRSLNGRLAVDRGYRLIDEHQNCLGERPTLATAAQLAIDKLY